MNKDTPEGIKIVYHGNNTSFPLDNAYASAKLRKGKIYTVDYTMPDIPFDVNNCVCLKEDTCTDWDILLFNTVTEYINELLNTFQSEYIYLCKADGTAICKFNRVDHVVTYDDKTMLFYSENDFIAEIAIYSFNSIIVDSYDNIVIYVKY